MIFGLSSIREDSKEDDQGQTPKLTLQKTVQSNVIPALHQERSIKPFVPELYSIGANKRNISTNIDSFTNVSISKLAVLNQNNMTRAIKGFDMSNMEELPENAHKNPTSFDLVGLDDFHKTNKLSNDKIDSFLEITNRLFKKDIPLMSSLQLTELINKDTNNKVYLPPRRFKFKGINVKHSITIVGSPESVLNFYEAGFNFAETFEPKELDLQQINIKLHDPLKLFNVYGHSCSISLQNSVIQCSHKNLTSFKQASRFMYVASPDKKPIEKLVIQLESTVIQNFDTLLEIEEGVNVDLVHIRLCSSKLLRFSKLLDIRKNNIKTLKIELIDSIYDSVSNLLTLGPCSTNNLSINAYKNTFYDCKTIIDMQGYIGLKGNISFLDNLFINGGLLFILRGLNIPLTFSKCLFKSIFNKCFVLDKCETINVHNCCFTNNKIDLIIESIDTQLEFYKNTVTDNIESVLRITGSVKGREKIIRITDNNFVHKKGKPIDIDKKAKNYTLNIENNNFESDTLPLCFSKLSKSVKITIKSNCFKIKETKENKIKNSRLIKTENNVYEYGYYRLDHFDTDRGNNFDHAFCSSRSEQEIIKLFGDDQNSIS